MHASLALLLSRNMNNGNDSKQSSRTIQFYFAPASAPAVSQIDQPKAGKTAQDSNNETMGLSSNLRKSAIKRAREYGTQPPAVSRANRQRTLNGQVAEGRVDEGTKDCKACTMLERNPKWKQHSHDKTCPRNKDYKKTDGGRKNLVGVQLEKLEQERWINLTTRSWSALSCPVSECPERIRLVPKPSGTATMSIGCFMLLLSYQVIAVSYAQASKCSLLLALTVPVVHVVKVQCVNRLMSDDAWKNRDLCLPNQR